MTTYPLDKDMIEKGLLDGSASLRDLVTQLRWKLPREAGVETLAGFLLTRLVDWLDVPPGALVRPKDPLEYARKLRFHQMVKSSRDYGVIGQ